MKKLFIMMGLSVAFFPAVLCAGEEVFKDKEGMDCYLYTPESIEPEREYQLVVGVHGLGGNGRGAGGLRDWANRGDVIVLGPSFVSKGAAPYQNGDGIHADKLLELWENLQKKHKLRAQMFLHGFSGGSQFVHRFAMNHPKVVCGVSAHSGGSWATDNYGSITSEAKKIIFAISCGEEDKGKSFPQAPYGRLEWFGRFQKEMEQKKFVILAKTWPGVGHGISDGVNGMLNECFQISTGLPGGSASEEVPISAEWKNLDPKKVGIRLGSSPSSPQIENQAVPEDVLEVAFRKAKEELIPDAGLITFLQKYPARLWKEKEGSEPLLTQCQRAAVQWRATAKQKGTWSMAVEQNFKKLTDGLELVE